MSLREPQITVEAVQQNLKRILQRLEMMLLCGIFLRPHLGLRFQSKRAQISEQMAEDLQLIAHRKTIEFQHDQRIERSDVAVPDVVRNSGEENISVCTFDCAHHRQLGNGMALPEILTQAQRIDWRYIAAQHHVLIAIGKNLGTYGVA